MRTSDVFKERNAAGKASPRITATSSKAPPSSSSLIPVVNTERASAQYYIDCVTAVLEKLGWKNVGGPPVPGTSVVWSEDPVNKPRLLALPHGCRTNRFYAMIRVCRKVCLAQLLDACERLHPAAFSGLAPRTWWVGSGDKWEDQLNAHRKHCARDKAAASCAYIVKPDNGCQGAGITLVIGHQQLQQLLESESAPERCVVQSYLPNPLLVDGLKFDLRLYVVMTCASPLQAFLSTRGVARFASHKWCPVDKANQDDMMMHLSNSSINQVNTGVSNKWELPRLWKRLAEEGHDVEQLWLSVHKLVALTLAAMQPPVAHAHSTAFTVPFKRVKKPPAAAAGGSTGSSRNSSKPASRRPSTESTGASGYKGDAAAGSSSIDSTSSAVEELLEAAPSAPAPAADGVPQPEASGIARRCFQILGFDVMLDAQLKPWLLEVNHSPSMALQGNDELECDAKCSVLNAALQLGLSDEHTEALCSTCEVEPLHQIARPLCDALEGVRKLFESHATSRSAQQWTLNLGGFEKLLQPAMPLLGSPSSSELRGVFEACWHDKVDVGSGWDAPAAGQLTLWGFTEAMLRLAKDLPPEAGAAGGAAGGLAPQVERLVAACAV